MKHYEPSPRRNDKTRSRPTFPLQFDGGIVMFDFVDFVFGLVSDILLALVPTYGKNRLWYLIISCLILLACSLCAFLAEAVVQARS